jgi:thioredoxin 1
MIFSELISQNEFVLIDFYATWCEPCKWVVPVLDEVIKNFDSRIALHKIDIDEHAAIAREQHILSVPSLVLYKNGNEVWRMRGFDTAPVLIGIFNELMDAG